MKEIYIPGYFTEGYCKKIQEKMNGATYMNFDITYSNCCGNCTLIVRGKASSKKELQEMFFSYALCLVAQQ